MNLANVKILKYSQAPLAKDYKKYNRQHLRLDEDYHKIQNDGGELELCEDCKKNTKVH